MSPLSTTRGAPRSFPAAIAIAIAAIALTIGVLTWVAPDDDAVLPREEAIPVSEIFDEPGRYLGREITVTGEVSVLTDRVMSLGDEDLIVVSNRQGAAPFAGDRYFVDDVVYATGELRMLDAVDLVERLPNVSVLHSQFQEFDRQPVLLASDVVPSALDR